MRSYNSMVRPVANDSESISVKFGVTLRQIIDVVREPSTPFVLRDCVLYKPESLRHFTHKITYTTFFPLV